MALPTTRKEFAEWCLRRLGKPVIEINVSEEQVDDRIDEALKYYADYHFDGSHKIFLKHQIVQADIDNGYIDIADDVIGITRVFPLSTIMSVGMFSASYQLAFNSIQNLSTMSGGINDYYSMRQNMNLMQEILVGQTPIRFNRHRNRLHIDTNWANQSVGEWIVAEGYAFTDPDVYADVWKDKWLLRYTTELIREQWGHNLTKFVGMTLPGGVQYNGEAILAEARENLARMEEEMISSYSLPVTDMIG
jgi:hypothetical protein